MSRLEFEVKDTNGQDVKLVTKTPTYEDIENANRANASKVASLVRERGSKKLLTRQELNDFLRDNGIWTAADEKKIEKLSNEIDGLLRQLRKGGEKLSKGREICIEIMDKRKDMVAIASKRQQFDDATIESIAETEKIDYFVYACTVHAESGENYWQSFEDMKNDKSSEVFGRSYVNTMKAVFGIDAEFEKQLPENKWLKKYNFINDSLEYTDRKTGQKIDKFGKPVSEIEDEVKTKLESLQGDIVEEQPFVDDETNEPVKV